MQKIFITYLSVLILFQGMFSYVDIFFELGEVIEDYKLHQNEYGDNLNTFIAKHFGNLKEQHKEQHKKEHQQHKHQDKSEISSTTDFVCLSSENNIKPFKEIICKTDNFFYKDLFSTFEKQKIFQPPQLA